MLNGMPTAELSVPAFAGLGVRSYSSAVFSFVPELAWAFYRASTDGDEAARLQLLEGFYRPFAELRDRVRGYAVALIKAGVGITLRCLTRSCLRFVLKMEPFRSPSATSVRRSRSTSPHSSGASAPTPCSAGE
jgi:hypothetical protein